MDKQEQKKIIEIVEEVFKTSISQETKELIIGLVVDGI